MIARAFLACLVVAAFSGPAAAAEPPVERLFFTPAQRASLDVARSQRTRATVATERTEQLVVEQPTPQTITYGGMVRRSDGQTTVWINDRAIDGQEAAGGATIIRRVGPDGAVTVDVPQSQRRVDLKVGQSVEVLSGSIGEASARTAPESRPDTENAAPAPRPRSSTERAAPESSTAPGAPARGAAPAESQPRGN
jgi:hypothetical protein